MQGPHVSIRDHKSLLDALDWVTVQDEGNARADATWLVDDAVELPATPSRTAVVNPIRASTFQSSRMAFLDSLGILRQFLI